MGDKDTAKLTEIRERIDAIDKEMASLFERRMALAKEVAETKKENGLPIFDEKREQQVVEKNAAYLNDQSLKEHYIAFINEVMKESKRYQQKLLSNDQESEDSSKKDGFCRVIRVNIPQNEYDIVIERGALSKVDTLLDLNRKVLIVTDDGVPRKYVDEVLSRAPNATCLTLFQGDANKNLSQYGEVLSKLSELGFSRSDAVIALGGGMIGDLAGFAAATYMRGIDFYNIPTTLLSQVDSSIGGKTAVNLEGIKNIVGAFYQPKKVIIDVNTLDTLSDRLFYEGLVEAIKMAATSDASLFEEIENCHDLRKNIEDIITRALLIKKNVVELDTKEKGPRMMLNFGHTVGHAIEALGKGKYFHGEAVGIGMLYVSEGEAKNRIENLLLRLGLPTCDSYTAEDLMAVLTHDKKKRGEGVTLCLVDSIGKSKLVFTPFEEVERMIRRKKANEE